MTSLIISQVSSTRLPRRRPAHPCVHDKIPTIPTSTRAAINTANLKKSFEVRAKARRDGAAEIVKNVSSGNSEDDDKIAPEVWERMMARILFFVGAPMGSGVALLVIFSALKDKHVWDVPLWLPFLTTLLCFGSSAIGIAYGTLSTSLDPKQKGSLLGWEQVQHNWPEMWRAEDESNK